MSPKWREMASHLFSLKGKLLEVNNCSASGEFDSRRSDSKYTACVYKFGLDEIFWQVTPWHLKFKLMGINGVRVLQRGGRSVCINYGPNKVC